jgi:hypothetical protein
MVVRSQSEIDELLRKRDLVALREMLKNWSPSALVRVMTGLATEDQLIVLRILPRELAAEAFESLDLPWQERFRPAGSPLGPSPYCTNTHRVLRAPHACLATRLSDFATNRHE